MRSQSKSLGAYGGGRPVTVIEIISLCGMLI